MNNENNNACRREHDFALIVTGVPKLDQEVFDAFFEAGCDDATLSFQHGVLYIEFSREAASLKDAILSAIHDVRRANVDAEVLRVDECDLVTPSEIARKIGRSRQLVFQYISGQRGPGGFPPPECHLVEGKPLWAWCAVSYWMVQHNILRPEESWNAAVVAAINNQLESARHHERYSTLVDEIVNDLQQTR